MQRFCPHQQHPAPCCPFPLRLVPAALLLLLLAMPVLLPTAARAQQRHDDSATDVRVTQVDSSNYPQVTLYVAVHDATGEPVPHLERSDFHITEDGQPVTVGDFQGSGAQINTALVIDRSDSMNEEDKLAGAQAAAQTFIAQMRPGDQTALLAFNEAPRMLHHFSNNTSTLEEQVERITASEGTAIYDSIIEGVDELRYTEGRRVLLLLTDGNDSCHIPDSQCSGSSHSLEEAIAYANQYEQPVYVVGLGDRSSAADAKGSIDEEVLQRIADETYGAYFYAPDGDELVALYGQLAGDLQNEYILTYTSPRPFFDGTRRDIQVGVGSTTSAGSYTERHLINVDSSLVVGVLLLLPLLALLFLPTLATRAGWKMGTRRRKPALQQAAPPPAPATSAQQPPPRDHRTRVLHDDAHQCIICHAALTPGASFCTECGAPQSPEATPTTDETADDAQPVCATCGYKLRPGARFCGKCGTAQPAERNEL